MRPSQQLLAQLLGAPQPQLPTALQAVSLPGSVPGAPGLGQQLKAPGYMPSDIIGRATDAVLGPQAADTFRRTKAAQAASWAGRNILDPLSEHGAQFARGLQTGDTGETLGGGAQAAFDVAPGAVLGVAGKLAAPAIKSALPFAKAVAAPLITKAMAVIPGKAKGVAKAVTQAIDAAVPGKLKAPWYDKVLETKMPQVAERYPIEGYPKLDVDPKKVNPDVFPEAPSQAGLGPKIFPAKNLSPEGEQVQKMREAAQAKIDAEGFTPYFDPKKRFDVNPKNYPDYAELTLTQVPPGTSKTSRAVLEAKTKMANDPAALKRLEKAYKEGLLQKEDAGNWYFMGQLEKRFTDEFGAKEGRKQFQQKFAEAMAATTGGADPNANWMMAQYGNFRRAHGLDIPEESYNYPFPVGGRYAAGNMEQYRKILMGSASEPATGINRMQNAKRYNFAGDFLGHPNPTMDEQMLAGAYPTGGQGGKPLQSVPSEHYGIYQQPVVKLAKKYGVEPKAFQDIGWAGFKNLKMKADAAAKLAKAQAKSGVRKVGIGHNNPPEDLLYKAKPMIQQINESIERTHMITGMPREEIVKRGLLRSEIPMYAIPGAVGLGAMAGVAGNRKQQPPQQY